jgi:hypothetical protein
MSYRRDIGAIIRSHARLRRLSIAGRRCIFSNHDRACTTPRRIVSETEAQHPQPSARSDSRSLAAALAPALQQSCDGRLGDITWFKTDWQRGGAATGMSTWRLDDDPTPRKVIVKLPVVQREFVWSRRLQGMPTPEDGVAPRLYASDESVGGYDLAWIVIERFEFGPLGLHWHDDHITRLADAAARFHVAAAAFDVDQPPRVEDWPTLLAESAESVKVNNINHRHEWTDAIKSLKVRIDRLAAEWDARHCAGWLHGDLHLANAMSRVAADHGPVSLIDLAEVHVGHWIEDAIYLERQLWAKPDRLKAHKPVKELAAARRKHGLSTDDDYPRLAAIRRALLASTAPRFIKSEGHPAYLEACLNRLQQAIVEVK